MRERFEIGDRGLNLSKIKLVSCVEESRVTARLSISIIPTWDKLQKREHRIVYKSGNTLKGIKMAESLSRTLPVRYRKRLNGGPHGALLQGRG